MTGNAEKQGFGATGFEIAPTEVVDGYEQELYRLLVVIAETSKPDDPEGCAQEHWVSDESLVRDSYSFLDPSKEDMDVLVEGWALRLTPTCTWSKSARSISTNRPSIQDGDRIKSCGHWR
jgi:hypothetical protein